jgi:hypothetical protein
LLRSSFEWQDLLALVCSAISILSKHFETSKKQPEFAQQHPAQIFRVSKKMGNIFIALDSMANPYGSFYTRRAYRATIPSLF